MAKVIDYPRASLANATQLADIVDSLGGSAKIGMAAEKMGRKVSGAFNAVISAAVKYSLLSSKDGRLATTQLYRDIKLAYTDEEKKNYLRAALLSPPIFSSIAERFAGRKLPVEHFDRLLIREFGVTDDMAPRVASYFLEGAKQAGLLTEGNALAANDGNTRLGADDAESAAIQGSGGADVEVPNSEVQPSAPVEGSFSVTFRGPGLNATVVINDEDDVLIVEATLRKIKKKLQFDSQ